MAQEKGLLLALGFITWGIVALGLNTPITLAADRETLIALDLDAPAVNAGQASALILRFRDELARTGRFTLVDRGQMDQALQEQGYRGGAGCNNPKCYTAIAKALGVPRLVHAHVARQGSAFAVSAQYLEIDESVTVFPVSVQVSGGVNEILNGGLAKLADRIASAGTAKAGDAQSGAATAGGSIDGAKAWLDKGYALRQPNGEFQPPELAAYQFSKAISAEPNSAVAHAARGEVYLQLQQYEDALKDYDQAIRLEPRRAAHYYGRSQAYRGLRQTPQMCADLRKACEFGDQGTCGSIKKSGC